MAVEIATGYVSIVPSMRGFSQKLSADVSKSAGVAGDESGKKFSSGMMQHIKGLAVAFAGAFAVTKGIAFFKDSIKEASDLNESINAVNVTFGKSAKGIQKLSSDAATAMGLSKTEFNALAVRFSNFADTVAGKGGDVVGTMKELTGRAADFASVMNLDVNDAAELFQSGLAGETEPLRKYGIDLSAAAVTAYAYANGIAKTGEELTESQKVQARYSLLMKSTAKSQGDFANTSDGLANKQRIMNAEWKNAKASIGQSLLPVMSALTGFIADKVVPAVQAFGDWFKNDGGPAIANFGATLRDTVLPPLEAVVGWLVQNKDVILPIAGIVLAMVTAYKTWAMVTGLLTVAQTALNFALSANPIGIIVMAVAGLIAGLVLAYNKVGWFRDIVDAAWQWIKTATEAVWPPIQKIIETAWKMISWWVEHYIKAVWAVISTVWDWIKKGVEVVWPGIQKTIEGVWAAIKWYVTTYIHAVKTVIETVWGAIKTATSIAWVTIKTAIINPIKAAYTRIVEIIGNVRTWLSEVWTKIKDRASVAWQNVKEAVLDPVLRAKDRIVEIVGNVRTWLSDAWTTVKDRASTAWNNIKDAILDPLRGLWGFFKTILGIGDNGIADDGPLGKLIGIFSRLKDRIGDAFSGIKDLLVKPIVDAFKWINTEVLDPLNTKLLDKIKAPNIPLIPIPDGYATGGLVTGPGTGTSDSVLARLSNGEFVVNAKAAAANRGLLEAVNRNGQPVTGAHLQSGGGFNPARWIGNLFTKGAGVAIRALTDPAMDYLRRTIGEATIGGRLALGSARSLFETLGKWGDKQDLAPSALMEAMYQHMRGILGHTGYFQECLATIHAALDSLQQRFGFVTGGLISGSPDPNHIIGSLGAGAFNKTDAPRGALAFWRFPGAYGHIAVATGRGNESINNWGGDSIVTADNIGSPGYAGWLPPERFVSKFDSGGFLPPGWSMAYNGTGKPEPVLTSAQWDSMGSRVTNNWTVHAKEAPTVDATMRAWKQWEALQGGVV